jgi:hypothetical protein
MTESTKNGILKVVIEWIPKPGTPISYSQAITGTELTEGYFPVLKMTIADMLESMGGAVPLLRKVAHKEGWDKIEAMPESESFGAKVVINRSCPIDCRLPHKITLENASEIADKLAEVLRRSRQVRPEDLKKPITVPELGGVEAGMTKPLASDPTATGSSIPPSGFLTDEPGLSVISAMDEKALGMLEDAIDWRNHPECQTAVDHLYVRLALLVKLQKDIAVLANGTISLLLERKKKSKATDLEVEEEK